jgi:hypothetical protein
MKNLLIIVLAALVVSAKAEVIKIQTPYSASHSGTPALLAVLEEANRIQKDYTFVLEFKPGANQLLSIKEMDQRPQNNLSVVAASIVENHELGHLNIDYYAAIYSLGDACWAVMSTTGKNTISSMKNTKEIIVGTVATGNATHLTALEIGKKYNISVMLVPFRSNNDAVINMAGGHGVNFGMDRIEMFINLSEKNSNLGVVGVSCPKRLAAHPSIPTLAEQGVESPYVFNIIIANRSMNSAKRDRIGKILTQATVIIGEEKIFNLSGFVPPVFNNQTAEVHFKERTQLVQQLRNRHRDKIQVSRQF